MKDNVEEMGGGNYRGKGTMKEKWPHDRLKGGKGIKMQWSRRFHTDAKIKHI